MVLIILKKHGMVLKSYSVQIVLLFIVLNLFSCTQEDTFMRDVKQKIGQRLKEWNYETKLRVEKDTLIVNFIASNSKNKKVQGIIINDFFLDKYSNEMLLKSLIESNYEFFDYHKDKKIKIKFKFDSYSDQFNYFLDEEKLAKIHKEFEEIDYDMAIYTLKEIRYVGVVQIEYIIKFLRENSNVKFEGNFWELLKEYTIACKNPKDNLTAVVVMVETIGLLLDKEYKWRKDFDFNKLYYYLDHCGFKHELLNMTFPELLDYLDKTYYENGA